MKVYISLPISGQDKFIVQERARMAKEEMKNYGHDPITPFDVSPDEKATYAEHMGRDIQALLECEAVYFLQGWHNSNGCRAEYEIARIYGKNIFFE